MNLKIRIVEKHEVYCNNDGYRILKGKILDVLEGEYTNTTITICGYLPVFIKGEEVTIAGSLDKHEKYGWNITVTFFERTLPTTKDKIIKLLSSSLFKGIGKKIATMIYDELGANAIKTIGEQGEQSLSKISITEEKKSFIVQTIQEHFLLNEAILFYTPYGIKIEQIIRLYQLEKNYKNLIDNPYLFAKHGIVPFELSDQIAFENGFMQHNSNRLETAISLILKEELRNGHCFINEDTLLKKLYIRLNRNKSTENQVFESILINGLLTSKCAIAEHGRVYPKFIYFAEKRLAQKVSKMVNTSLSLYNEFEINRFINFNFPSISKEQRAAVHLFLNHNLFILTGDGGTGKTFTIDKMIQTYLYFNPNAKIALVAPTARAAKRIEQSTDIECHAITIHRLLGYGRNGIDDRPFYNADNPLDYDLVIADEFSMADIELASNLLVALKDGAKLCLSGDPDQLESIGPGSVLKDLLKSNVPQIHLTTLYRQDAMTKLAMSCRNVKKGLMIDLENDPSQYFIHAENNMVIPYLLAAVKKLLKQGVNINDIMILSPINSGINGVNRLNEVIQNIVNPKSKSKRELNFMKKTIREGDKIMYLVNDPEKNIFNGDIGIVQRINIIDNELTLNFDGNIVILPRKKISDLTLAYASSIHKAQGDQSPYVISIVTEEHESMLKRNLFYTGISRTEKTLILIGQISMIYRAIHNVPTTSRRTNLKERIYERLKNKSSKIHNLKEPSA